MFLIHCILMQVGIMGAEGYCVNIPWKCDGVGDNDYIFGDNDYILAFRHVVLPIGSFLVLFLPRKCD